MPPPPRCGAGGSTGEGRRRRAGGAQQHTHPHACLAPSTRRPARPQLGLTTPRPTTHPGAGGGLLHLVRQEEVRRAARVSGAISPHAERDAVPPRLGHISSIRFVLRNLPSLFPTLSARLTQPLQLHPFPLAEPLPALYTTPSLAPARLLRLLLPCPNCHSHTQHRQLLHGHGEQQGAVGGGRTSAHTTQPASGVCRAVGCLTHSS